MKTISHPAKKHFGQHFLHDEYIIQQIIDAFQPRPTDKVIEIGPGLGALTRPLSERLTHLLAIELDKDLIPALQQLSKQDHIVEIIEADILTVQLSSLSSSSKYRIIGNLPYNISTPLLFHLLAQATEIHDMLFMVQKEVAERICANHGNKSYGRLSVMMQYYCETHFLFNVPPSAFSPPPKVDSSIIYLKPYTSMVYQADDENILQNVVREAFNQRRKTIRNSLKKWLTVTELELIGINPLVRAEQLLIHDFVNIANYLVRHHKICE